MYAWWMRFNTIIAFGMFVLFGCLAVNWVTSFWLRNVTPPFELKVRDAQLKPLGPDRTNPEQTLTRVDISLDIEGDLQQLFNWNTQQVFLYVEASLRSPDGRRSSHILWDKIITDAKEAAFQLKALRKYNIFTTIESIKEPWNITAFYDITPIGGLIYRMEGPSVQHHLKAR